MLQDPQASLHNNILQGASRWDIDGATLGGDNDDSTLQDNASGKVHISGDGEMIELDDLGDGRDALLELCYLLEVCAELDQWCRTEAVRIHHELAVF